MSDAASTCVRVPGKVMLAGEYAVLDGGVALAVTVGRYLSVELRPTPHLGGCQVSSELWPELALVRSGADPAEFTAEPLLAAVAHAMRVFALTDLTVAVTSELTVSYGIGSSSALRLGVLLAFNSEAERRNQTIEAQLPKSAWHCAREALRLQRQAQTRASGYDLATQLVGGLCQTTTGDDLSQWPLQLHQVGAAALGPLADLVQVYVGGAGAPTAPLLQSTYAWLTKQAKLPELQLASTALNAAFIAAFAAPEDPEVVAALIAACVQHRSLFTAGPAFPTGLASDLEAQPGCDQTWSFKTTGAGGEDALLLIGPRAATRPAAQVLQDRGWEPLAADFCADGAQIICGASRG